MQYHISDHQITLYYFFEDNIAINKITFAKLVDTGISSRHSKPLTKKNSKLLTNNLWNLVSHSPLSSDLIPNIHQMFNGKNALIKTWQLDSRALNLLNGQTIQVKKNQTNNSSCVKLSLSLNTAAESRLEKENCDKDPCLVLQNIYFHQFKTKYGVARIELTLNESPPSPLLIQEVLYSLASRNTLSWQEPDDKHECHTQTSLGLIIRQLLQEIDTSNKTEMEALKNRRVYTNTYIQLKASSSESGHEIDTNKYLIRLAKHYNSDYQVSDSSIGHKQIIKDFDNIQHLITHEGSATLLLLDEKSPSFLNGYRHNINNVFNPIHLLAYYTENAIKHYIADGTVWLDSHCPSQKLQDKLQQHQLDLLNLNYNFFHPVISAVDTHNIIQNQLIQVNQLDKQHQKITEHNQIINQLITNCLEQQKQKEHKRQLKEHQIKSREYCEIAQIGVAAITFYTSFQIIEAIQKLITQEKLFSDAPTIFNYLQNHSTAIALTTSSLIAFFALKFTQRRCGHSHKAPK